MAWLVPCCGDCRAHGTMPLAGGDIAAPLGCKHSWQCVRPCAYVSDTNGIPLSASDVLHLRLHQQFYDIDFENFRYFF